MSRNSFEVLICQEFKEYVKNEKRNLDSVKVLINPNLKELLESKDHVNLFKYMRFL